MTAERLAAAQRHRFADWPNSAMLNWRAGIYGVWRDDEFLYVGMAGRGLARDAHLAEDPRTQSTHATAGSKAGSKASTYLAIAGSGLEMVMPDEGSSCV